MINQFLQSFKVIGKENRTKAFKLLGILLIIIFLELLNFSLIIPILSIIFDEGGSQDINLLSYLHDFLGNNTSSILVIGLIFLIIIITKIILLVIFEYKTQKYSREINVDITLKAYSYFLYTSWQEILNMDHAYIMRNILTDTAIFVAEGIIKFIDLIKNTFFLICIMGYLFFVSFKATFIIVTLLIIFTLIFIFFLKKKLLKLSGLTIILDKFRYKNISESILSLRDIKLSRNANYFLNLFKINEIKVTKAVIATRIMSILPRYLLEIIIVSTLIFTVHYLQTQNFNMKELIPVLGLYAFAMLRMVPIFVVYNQGIQAIRVSKFAIDEVIKNAGRFQKLYNEKKSINKKLEQDNINLKEELKIKITDLSFSYNKSSHIFENLNLEINKDYTIYLEGPNGSGKSTFVDLSTGMLIPSKGKIEINGVNLNEIADAWLKNVGYVSQTNFLTNNSIKDNIIFGRENISEKKVFDVLKIVELDDLIKSLPNGINTDMGSLGGFFSGGQKQRIAIARALVKNPNVIILDEATNALDKEMEKNFLEIIDKIKKNRIIIFIAHSKTIKNFCDINFLINDKMIELTKKKIND